MRWVFVIIFQSFIVFAFLVFCAAMVSLCKMLPEGWIKRFLLMKVD